jgi:hypothetical protein
MLATDHDRFDDDLSKACAPRFVDTRGRDQDPVEHLPSRLHPFADASVNAGSVDLLRCHRADVA